MKESHARNRTLLNKFMTIFRLAPEEGKKWLVREPLVPQDMKFSNYIETRDVALPLHSVFFLGDSDILEELMPFLTKADFEVAGPYGASFLHMLISGIEFDAPQISAPKCAKILLSITPNLRTKSNHFSATPEVYAMNVISKSKLDKEKVSALKALLDVIKNK